MLQGLCLGVHWLTTSTFTDLSMATPVSIVLASYQVVEIHCRVEQIRAAACNKLSAHRVLHHSYQVDYWMGYSFYNYDTSRPFN